jgi:hypothetical protein
MYLLVAYRNGKPVECVPGFAEKRDAQSAARRLNSLPTHWRNPDGRLYRRPSWEVECQGDSARGPAAAPPRACASRA